MAFLSGETPRESRVHYFPCLAGGRVNHTAMFTKISLAELVTGLVLLMLPIYVNALERTTLLGITDYL